MMATNAKRLLARLRRPWQGTAPRGAETWDAEYESGRWEYLGEQSELARFSVLIGYMTHFKPGGSVLDIGCGTGVLYQRMQPHGYSRYVGVDLSGSAIGKIVPAGDSLASRSVAVRDERSTFLAADGEYYEPDGKFDIAVFNEVLYFFRDPQSAVQRYAGSLQSGGIILVSTCTAFKGGTGILDGLKQTFRVLDETRVTHGSNPWSWLVTALQP